MDGANSEGPMHTLRSHGRAVLKFHFYDWIILILLAVVDAVLNVIEPFHRFVGQDMMADLRYPLKKNTIPFWAVPVIAIIGPFIIISLIYLRKKNVYDFHNAILGLLFSVLVTSVITDAIKDGVGRPRPDFYWRCFPDGVGVYDNMTTQVICHGEKSVIKEGHKSFPSGHTSWSFAGLGFLSWYLAGKIRVFDQKGHVGKLCLVLSPLLLAALVAVSRVDDYWHHWQDVTAGGLIGVSIASICYLQFFPFPSSLKGFWPHAYEYEIIAANARVQVTANPGNPQEIVIEPTNSIRAQNGDQTQLVEGSESKQEHSRIEIGDASAAGVDLEAGRKKQ